MRFYRKTALILTLVLAAALLSGCRVQVNLNKSEPPLEDMLSEAALTIDPPTWNAEGKYAVTVHYDAGGFEKMDLSRAYVGCFPYTVFDRIDAITGGETDGIAGGDEGIPPLPADAQSAVDAAVGADTVRRIAVITMETVDDTTLKVSFTDSDDALQGKEYFFVIPNEGLAGTFTAE